MSTLVFSCESSAYNQFVKPFLSGLCPTEKIAIYPQKILFNEDDNVYHLIVDDFEYRENVSDLDSCQNSNDLISYIIDLLKSVGFNRKVGFGLFALVIDDDNDTQTEFANRRAGYCDTVCWECYRRINGEDILDLNLLKGKVLDCINGE